GKEKISKSKGGAEPIPKAAETYGVDAMRLYYSHVSSPFVDVEWDPSVVTSYRNRVSHIWNLAQEILSMKEEENPDLDKWMKSMFARRIKRINEFMERYDLRDAANDIFFEIPNDIRWYRRRGGNNGKLLKEMLGEWVKLMAPFTPHLAEEIWEKLGNKGFVSLETFPEYDESMISTEAEAGELLIKGLMEDIQEILKVTGIKAKKIYVYTAEDWKWDVYEKILKGEDVGKIMKELMQREELRKLGKEVSKFIKDSIADLKKLPEQDKKRFGAKINEFEILRNAVDFLEKEFGAEVVVEKAEKPVYDPANKSRYARPLKPAIYVE
ncbi:MAG TPA: leucine--tRNA ligase, partial [Thermoplasmatales archaeon]|nr:leucine--tRNA ligase [Thermoplasmatales archaeon]